MMSQLQDRIIKILEDHYKSQCIDGYMYIDDNEDSIRSVINHGLRELGFNKENIDLKINDTNIDLHLYIAEDDIKKNIIKFL